MTDGPEQTDRVGQTSEKEQKLSAKEQKRAEKAAARARRQAEQAQLEDETAGKLSGFRVFKDGTIQKELSSQRLNAAVGAWRNKLSQTGLASDSGPSYRSAVTDVALIDKRIRKPFARARSAVHMGLFSSGKDHFGTVTLKIATRDWTETLTASEEQDVSALIALRDLLQEVTNVAAGSEGATREAQLDPPASPPDDIAGALRELKGLHDEGLLTDDEFEVRRKALVDRLPDGR